MGGEATGRAGRPRSRQATAGALCWLLPFLLAAARLPFLQHAGPKGTGTLCCAAAPRLCARPEPRLACSSSTIALPRACVDSASTSPAGAPSARARLAATTSRQGWPSTSCQSRPASSPQAGLAQDRRYGGCASTSSLQGGGRSQGRGRRGGLLGGGRGHLS